MNVKCPYCQALAIPGLRTRDYNQQITTDSFDYFRCAVCDYWFLHPIPDDLGKYYPNSYYAIPSSVARLRQSAERQRYQIETIQKFARGGRLLDIGPGNGAFAYLARQSGFEVQTLEMDGDCCRYLRDVIGVGAIQTDDPAFVLPQLPLQQVITLWHVVEHLRDPWLCLQRAAERLAPGGILLVATPNPQALQFRVFRSRWVHLDAPRHVSLIPAPLLARALTSYGLRPVLVNSNDPGGRALNVYGWRASLVNLSPRRLARAAAWRLGLPLGRLASIAETHGFPGSTYTAIFRNVDG